MQEGTEEDLTEYRRSTNKVEEKMKMLKIRDLIQKHRKLRWSRTDFWHDIIIFGTKKTRASDKKVGGSPKRNFREREKRSNVKSRSQR